MREHICPYATKQVDVGGTKTYCEFLQTWTNCQDVGDCLVTIPDRCPGCGSKLKVELKWYDLSMYDMESHFMWEINCAADCYSHPCSACRTPQKAIDIYRRSAKACKPRSHAGEQMTIWDI